MALGVLCWAGVGLILWRVPPQTWVVEIATLALLLAAIIFTSSWIIGKSKPAVYLTLFLLGLLVMNRLQILTWVTLGIWVTVWGLISLIN